MGLKDTLTLRIFSLQRGGGKNDLVSDERAFSPVSNATCPRSIRDLLTELQVIIYCIRLYKVSIRSIYSMKMMSDEFLMAKFGFYVKSWSRKVNFEKDLRI